jgi:hypothetical protein
VPAVPARAFKEFAVSCLPEHARQHYFASSGTTEAVPSRHYHSADSLRLYELSAWTWFQDQVLRSGSDFDLSILAPAPARAPNSSLVHMFETVRKRLGVGLDAYGAEVGSAGEWILQAEGVRARLAVARRPVLLLGTAFMFVHLLDFLRAKGLPMTLPGGSKLMETGGYKGRSREIPKAQLHFELREAFGVKAEDIVCEYGMAELSSQAYARGVGGVLHFPPWARALVVSPENGQEVRDGETGLIRVVDLANVYSAMAIQTEDLGVRRGNAFELLGRATGAEMRGCSLMAI